MTTKQVIILIQILGIVYRLYFRDIFVDFVLYIALISDVGL